MNPRLKLAGSILDITGPLLALTAFASAYYYGGPYTKNDGSSPPKKRYERLKIFQLILTAALPILAKLGEIGYNHMYKKSDTSILAFKLVQLFCPVAMAYMIPNRNDNKYEASKAFKVSVVAVYTVGGCFFVGKQEEEIKKVISPWKEKLSEEVSKSNIKNLLNRI